MITLEYLRAFRIGEYSIFDLVASFLGVAILAPLLSKLARMINLKIPFLSWMYFVLPLSILVHLAVDRHTAMTRYFLDPTGHYLLKLVILLLTLLGLSGVSSLGKQSRSFKRAPKT